MGIPAYGCGATCPVDDELSAQFADASATPAARRVTISEGRVPSSSM